jgi:hypothetical protein
VWRIVRNRSCTLKASLGWSLNGIDAVPILVSIRHGRMGKEMEADLCCREITGILPYLWLTLKKPNPGGFD